MAFDFTSRPLRPRKADRLFGPDLPDESGDHAHLGSDPDAYTLGYRRAAEHLSTYALANPRECGQLAYPIVFLYRHHIELALKRIIYWVPWALKRDLTEQEKKNLGNHKLDRLWGDLEPIFGSVCQAVGWSKPSVVDLEGDGHAANYQQLIPLRRTSDIGNRRTAIHHYQMVSDHSIFGISPR